MPILTSIKDYAKRHRRGLMVTATIGGGGYFLVRYATGKLRDFQEKSLADRVAKENLKRRFQQNQNDCVFTVLSLLPTLGDQILYELNVEASWTKLQESRKWEKKEERRLKEEAEAAAAAAHEAEAAKEAVNVQQNQDAQEETKTEGETNGESVVGEDGKPNDNEQQKEDEEEAATKQEKASPVALDASVGSLGASTASLESAQTVLVSPYADKILDKKAKYVLWEDIKTTSFTRSMTAIYSVTLLTLLTHIQLNLLGRFTYVWSVSALNRSEPTIRLQHADEEPEGGFIDPQTERMYLSATWWITHRGWRLCYNRVKDAVDSIVGSMPLKRVLGYDDAEDILAKLRRAIEYEKDGTTRTSFLNWMLPDTPEEEREFLKEAGFTDFQPLEQENGITNLRRLLDETKDYIDSPDFLAVLSSCLDEGFAIFDHNAFGKTLMPGAGSLEFEGQRIREIDTDDFEPPKKMTLANLLPSISRQAHSVLGGNDYLNAFTYSKELQAFSAIIYTQYGEELINA